MIHPTRLTLAALMLLAPLAAAQQAEPYKGETTTIPGRIELENYDQGGEGVTYHDQDDRNEQRAYRNDGVDIARSKDPEDADGFMVVKTFADEWLQYTVDVTPGAYDLMLRGAGVSGRTATITLGGEELAVVNLPGEGWSGWQTVLVKDVTIKQDGRLPLRVKFDGAYSTNVNWIAFVPAGEGKGVSGAEAAADSKRGNKPAASGRGASGGSKDPAANRGREVAQVDRSKITGANVDESQVDVTLEVQPGPGKPFGDAFEQAKEHLKAGKGVKIVVAPGIYREYDYELDATKLGGGSKEALLIIEGTPGQSIFRGSEVLADWNPVPGAPGLYVHDWKYDFGHSEGGWGRHNPKKVLGHRNEQLFVNDEPMKLVLLEQYDFKPSTQSGGHSGGVHTYTGFADPREALSPGSFGVAERDENGNKVYVRLPGGASIGDAKIEAAVLGHTKGWLRGNALTISKHNVVLRGLTFERYAGNLSYEAVDFVAFQDKSLDSRRNILIEDCTFQWNSGGGLGVGTSSDVTLRRVAGNYNGFAGIRVGMHNGLIEDCEANYNNWRGHRGGMYAWAVAGFHGNVFDTLYRNCRMIGNLTDGMHMDGFNANVIVEDSIAAGNHRGIFFEISKGPVLVEDCLIVNNTKVGLMQILSDNFTARNNIVAGNAPKGEDDPQFKAVGYVRTGIINAGEQLGYKPWDAHLGAAVLEGNVIAGLTESADLIRADGGSPDQYNRYIRKTLSSDGNVWWTPRADSFAVNYQRRNMADIEGWRRETGQDKDSMFVDPKFTDPGTYDFTLQNDSPLLTGKTPVKGENLPTGKLDDATRAEMARFFEWADWGGSTGHFSDLEGLD